MFGFDDDDRRLMVREVTVCLKLRIGGIYQELSEGGVVKTYLQILKGYDAAI